MSKGKRNDYLIISILLGGLLFSVLISFFMHDYITDVNVIDISDYSDKVDNIYYNIESEEYVITEDGIRVIMSGWCAKKNVKTNTVGISLALKVEGEDTYYKIPAIIGERKDVTSYLDDGYNHDFSGFSTDIYVDSLFPEDKDYSIFILYTLNGKKTIVDTNIYLSPKTSIERIPNTDIKTRKINNGDDVDVEKLGDNFYKIVLDQIDSTAQEESAYIVLEDTEGRLFKYNNENDISREDDERIILYISKKDFKDEYIGWYICRKVNKDEYYIDITSSVLN